MRIIQVNEQLIIYINTKFFKYKIEKDEYILMFLFDESIR